MLDLLTRKIFEIPKQARLILFFMFLVILMDGYVFVYNQLLKQNILGPYLGAPFALVGEFLIVAIVVSLSLLFPQRIQKLFLTGLFVFLSLIYLSVLIYYREFKYFPTINLLSMVFHKGNILGDVTDVIWSLFKLSDLIFPFLFLIWIFVAVKYKGLKIRFKTRMKTGLICLLITSLLFVVYKTSFNLIYKLHSPWHQQMRPNPDLIISHIGFLPFCLEDFISFYRISKNTKKQLSQADKKLLLDYYQSIKSNKNEYTGKFKGFNLFLLQFESLSNIVINQKINGHEITPTVNRLIREGIYFSQFYTQEGAGPTTSSEFVTLNSIIAPTDSFVAISYRFNTFYTLANLFNLEGYHTFALHGNNGSYYNREFIYERYGFDEFYSKKRIDGQIVHRWIGDKDLLKKASEVAANCNSLFFGFPIMVTSHKNWDISSVFDLDTGSHPFSGRSEGYVKNINYSDQAIQLFLDRLEKSRLLENTIIMIYGDHSPKLLKKEIESIIGHDVTDLESKRLRVQIPFILWAPKGSIEPKVIHDVFPQIDVLPTIANLFDLGTHFGIGKDIFDIKNTNIACTQEFIITKNATYHKFNQSEMQVASGSTKEQPLKDVKPLCDIQMRISDLILRTDAVQYLKSLKE